MAGSGELAATAPENAAAAIADARSVFFMLRLPLLS